MFQLPGKKPPPMPQAGGAGFQQTPFAQMQNKIPMANMKRKKLPVPGMAAGGIPGKGQGLPSGPGSLPPTPGAGNLPPNPVPDKFEMPNQFQNVDLGQVAQMKTDLVRKVLPPSAKKYTGSPPPMSAAESEAQYAADNPAAAAAAERVSNEPSPAESSQGDGIDYQDSLAGLLARNQEVYDRDMENVHGLKAKLERDAASNNAIAGSTGAGGFFGALSSGANQQALNAMADASQKHAAREIDLRLDILGKQIQQAENAKDRDATKALKDKYEQYLRDRMSLEFPLPPDEEELKRKEQQEYLDAIKSKINPETGLKRAEVSYSAPKEEKNSLQRLIGWMNPFD